MSVHQFGTRLKELRESAGMSQKELCAIIGITLDGLSKLERGLRSPGWDTVVRICDALKVSCEDFRQEPASESAEAPRRGRPRKAPAEAPAETLEGKPAKGRAKRKGE